MVPVEVASIPLLQYIHPPPRTFDWTDPASNLMPLVAPPSANNKFDPYHTAPSSLKLWTAVPVVSAINIQSFKTTPVLIKMACVAAGVKV